MTTPLANVDLPGRLLVLTDRRQAEAHGRSLMDTLRAVASAGAPSVLFREKDLPADERRRVAHEIAEALAPTGARLLVASDLALARELGAAGLHLAANDPAPAGGTTPSALPFGRSCHSAAEVRAADREGAAWATLSPIFPSASKPGYGPPLGTAALDGHALPVLALGGVDASTVASCLAAGAHGVAVMGAAMTAGDPARLVASLLAQIDAAAA